MSKIHHSAGGAILQFLQSDRDEALSPTPPAGTAGTIEFDPAANPTVVANLNSDWNSHDCVGGVLRRNGSAVTINPELPKTTQSRAAVAGAVRLTVDRSTTSPNFQDVVGLQFQLEANAHYAFQFDGAYTAAAGTTGLQLALNGPAFSFLAAGFEIATSTTAWLAALAAAYDNGVNGTASGGGTALPFHIFGNISTTEAGLLIVRGRTEVNGSQVTIKRGSYGLLTKVG